MVRGRKHTVPTDEQVMIEAKLHEEAWQRWSLAWDAARDADAQAGRRYDKDKYSEAASQARREFLAAHGLKP